MNSKNWKSLIVIAGLSILATACGNDKDASAPTSAYTGIWANAEALQAFRMFGSDTDRFCDVVYEVFETGEYDGKRVDLALNGYIIQSNGDVLQYNSTLPIESADYRKLYFQGTVNYEGLFKLGSPAQVYNNPRDADSDHVIYNNAHLILDASSGQMQVFGENNYFMMRTDSKELLAYDAKLRICEDRYYDNDGGGDGDFDPGHDSDGEERVPDSHGQK